MLNRITLKVFAIAAVVAAGVHTPTSLAQKALAPDSAPASIGDLLAKAKKSGQVRVIVQFAEPRGVALDGNAAATAAYTSAVRQSQQAIVASVFGRSISAMASSDQSLSLMDFSPMFAVNVTPDELARLAADPRVIAIHEDKLSSPTLLQSLGIIKMTGAGNAYSLGATGVGRVVAILDSGVNKSHEFLTGKVISEACYNSTVPASGSTSRCPGGAPSSIAAGSGADCAATITGCGHGTHVAGIAAGKNTAKGPGEPGNGVAMNAKIIAINVFSRFSVASGFCGIGAVQDCILSWGSDQIRGLERVFALRNALPGRKIDAANMSLGGGGSDTFCNSDPLKPIIDQLRNVGIATVIASGNDGFVNGVSEPGCIQTAITVGSHTKSSPGNPFRMSSFTNQGPQVDTLAPGGDGLGYPTGLAKDLILSSRFSGYAFLAGTSMATPHVAGAIAAIRSRPACALKTVTQIENALHMTGTLITDHRIVAGFPQLKERRMNVLAVMVKLGCA